MNTAIAIQTTPGTGADKGHNTDAHILTRLFFGEQNSCVVFDTRANSTPGSISGAVLVSQSGALPPEGCLRQAPGFIRFSGEPEKVPGFACRTFDYINNPDGSIRWIIPAGSPKPFFLQLYNGSGWRGLFFRLVFRLGWVLGLRALLRSGTFAVYSRASGPLDQVLEDTRAQEYAIFTGTVGENRKVIIALQDARQRRWYFKMPLTAPAEQLVENEARTIRALRQLPWQKLALPEAHRLHGGVLLSDVRPAKTIPAAAGLLPRHLDALAELSAQTLEHKRCRDLDLWQEIGADLKQLDHYPVVNDLPEDLVAGCARQLQRLYRAFDRTVLPTAIAHGDFTPWNMFTGRDALHVYDWELSCRLPLLYDAFHHIFQSSVLVRHAPYKAIQEALSALECTPAVQDLLRKYEVDFHTLYLFYLLRNVSYYLARYVRQEGLHRQAHWLLERWHEALVGL